MFFFCTNTRERYGTPRVVEKPKCNEMIDNGSALPVLTHAIVLLYRGSGEGEGGGGK